MRTCTVGYLHTLSMRKRVYKQSNLLITVTLECPICKRTHDEESTDDTVREPLTSKEEGKFNI